MPTLTLTRRIACSQQHAFQVVSNVSAYPQFVPSCLGVRILPNLTATSLLAEMHVQVGPFSERYVSNVELHPICAVKATVTPDTGSSIFSYLNTLWQFESMPNDSAHVHFHIDFQFSSPLYHAFSSLLMHQISVKTMQAFEERMLHSYTPSIYTQERIPT